MILKMLGFNWDNYKSGRVEEKCSNWPLLSAPFLLAILVIPNVPCLRRALKQLSFSAGVAA